MYVVPDTNNDGGAEEIEKRQQKLVDGIIQKTVKLQSEYVFKMDDQFAAQKGLSDFEIEQQLKNKRQITLANHAVDDVKVFLRAQLHFLQSIYREGFTDEEDLKLALNEDLVKLVVHVLFASGDLYRVLLLLYRVDNFDFDRDLRSKYSSLKGFKTTDFSIDPYLSLANPVILLKEASARFGIQNNID